MRLFVAVWPPAPALAALAALDRPADLPLRWTTSEQWHVTLAFLGDVEAADVPAIEAALRVSSTTPATAVLGPATVRLGRETLVAPVGGLDQLAGAVAEATAPWGHPPEDRDFFGHVTLARARRRVPIPAALAGAPVSATWSVTEVSLVQSHLGAGGARYEDLASARLAAP